MTKLSDEQVALLELIGQTRETERNVRARVRADFDKIVAERQAPIHAQLVALVGRAYDLGTPKRQIGLAMGTTSVSTVTELLGGGTKEPEEIVEAVEDDFQYPTATILVTQNRASVTTLEGEALFELVDGEWIAFDDTEITLKMERALFGANPDPELRAAFDSAVSA